MHNPASQIGSWLNPEHGNNASNSYCLEPPEAYSIPARFIIRIWISTHGTPFLVLILGSVTQNLNVLEEFSVLFEPSGGFQTVLDIIMKILVYRESISLASEDPNMSERS